MRRWLIGSLFTLMALTAYAAEPGKDFNLDCEDGKILTGIIDKICWSCVLPMRIMGVAPNRLGRVQQANLHVQG